jgi:hypothetical protein
MSATGSYSQLADKGVDPRLSGLAAWQNQAENARRAGLGRL